MVDERRVGALVALVHVLYTVVEDELLGAGVDSVVSKVHEEVAEVLLVWHLVLLSCEPGQTLIEIVYPQRVY